jgi:disulfide bond formation protein DsbB
MLAPSQEHAAAAADRTWRDEVPAVTALIVALVGTLTIAGAWFFELVIKLKPCPMCLEQRWPYYIGIPLALIVALAAWKQAPRRIVVLGLVVLALLMLVGAAMGSYHAGVEWKWWPGPTECTGTPEFGGPGGLLNRLQTINIVRCDEAPWRLLGISLAGFNAIISLVLALVAAVGAKAALTKA